MTKQGRNFDILPAEILVKILCKLPVKALLKCLCVCKNWYSLIKTPDFIASLLDWTQKTKTQNLFLLRMYYGWGAALYLSFLDDPQFSNRVRLHFPFKTDFRPIGACNGVVCLVNYASAYSFDYPCVFLWNPSVRKVVVPEQQRCFPGDAFGFGFDSRNNDYKVVCVRSTPDCVRILAYSLSSDSWKSRDIPELKYERIQPDSVAFGNGILHWFAHKHTGNGNIRGVILGFDVNNEVFHEIMLPEAVSGPDISHNAVMAYRKSLPVAVTTCELGSGQLYTSKMEDSGVVESWNKLLILSEERWSVLGFRKNGNVLFEEDVDDIFSRDPVLCKYRSGLVTWGRASYSYLYDFVESLVLLDRGTSLTGMKNIVDLRNADDWSNLHAISVDYSSKEAVENSSSEGLNDDALSKGTVDESAESIDGAGMDANRSNEETTA